MSALSENNNLQVGKLQRPSEGVSRQTAGLQITGLRLVVFFLPIPFLLLYSYFSKHTSFFYTSFFLYGTAFEVIVYVLIEYLFAKNKVSKNLNHLYSFLNQIIVGLPFTIFIAAAYPLDFIFLLRYIPGFLLLLRSRKKNFHTIYSFLFIGGLFLYLFFQRFSWITIDESLLLFFIFLVNIFLFIAYAYFQRLRRSQSLEKRKGHKKLHLYKGLKLAVKNLQYYSIPKSESETWQNKAGVQPMEGDALVVSLCFFDLHEILMDGVGDVNRQDGLQHEWNLFCHYIQSEFEGSQHYTSSLEKNCLLLVIFLPDKEQGVASYPKLILALKKIMAFAQRSRNASLKRGLSYWDLGIGVDQGSVLLFRENASSPTPFFVGEVVQSVKNYSRKSKGLWTSPILNKEIHTYFPNLRSQSNQWQSPGSLDPRWKEEDFQF